MVELVGVNDSREINDGKLLIKLRDEVVVEAESKEVEDVLLVDEVEEVVEAEVDENEVVIGDELVEEVVGDELVEEMVEDELVEEVVGDELVEEMVEDELDITHFYLKSFFKSCYSFSTSSSR